MTSGDRAAERLSSAGPRLNLCDAAAYDESHATAS